MVSIHPAVTVARRAVEAADNWAVNFNVAAAVVLGTVTVFVPVREKALVVIERDEGFVMTAPDHARICVDRVVPTVCISAPQ